MLVAPSPPRCDPRQLLSCPVQPDKLPGGRWLGQAGRCRQALHCWARGPGLGDKPSPAPQSEHPQPPASMGQAAACRALEKCPKLPIQCPPSSATYLGTAVGWDTPARLTLGGSQRCPLTRDTQAPRTPLTLTKSWIWGFSAMLGGGCWLSGGRGKCRSCGPSQPTFLPGVHPLPPTPAPRPAVGPCCGAPAAAAALHGQLTAAPAVAAPACALGVSHQRYPAADGRSQVPPCVVPSSLCPWRAPARPQPGPFPDTQPRPSHPPAPTSLTGSSYYFFI